MLKKRLISTLIGLPLVFISIIMGGIYLKIFLLAISILGLYEFYNVSTKLNLKPIKYVGLSSVFLLYVTNKFINTENAIIMATMIIFIIPLLINKYNIKDTSITIAGIIYILFFSYIGKIRDLHNGDLLVWYIFIISWLTDTFAYFVGKYFGKNKLCPLISPNKTIEGAIGGLLGSLIGCSAFTLIFVERLGFNIIFIILLSVFGSIVAQTGDLFASSVKRNCQIKDYGNIIPGHGGILDRFDSILFVAPYIYFVFLYAHI